MLQASNTVGDDFLGRRDSIKNFSVPAGETDSFRTVHRGYVSYPEQDMPCMHRFLLKLARLHAVKEGRSGRMFSENRR